MAMRTDLQRIREAEEKVGRAANRLYMAERNLLDLLTRIGRKRVNEAVHGESMRLWWDDVGEAMDNGYLGDLRA